MADLNILSTKLGHLFDDSAILEEALTHSSLQAVQNGRSPSNERLEFLGDRVLGLVIADLLLNQFVDENEGDIARRHTALVRQEALDRVAREIGLGELLQMSDGEAESGGRQNPAILSNACEAVIAALYLDGGLAAASGFIQTFWRSIIDETPVPPKDAKSTLQEWAQGQGLDLPKYREIERDGPAHAPVFTIEVDVTGLPAVSASGNSKRAAEQNAAELLMGRIADVERV